jgi:hypothetical protein
VLPFVIRDILGGKGAEFFVHSRRGYQSQTAFSRLKASVSRPGKYDDRYVALLVSRISPQPLVYVVAFVFQNV